MQLDGIGRFQYKILARLCFIFVFARLIPIVDSVKPANPSASRQMCAKLQSMLSYGKYQTYQMPSNVTYATRVYTQNFLAYSSIDDLLLFIEPKHQINVYNAETIQLIANLTTKDVVIATSCTSLTADSRHDLFFIYETYSETNAILLRTCQVRFNLLKLNFDDIFCIDTLTIPMTRSDLRIYGFTIKRDHAGTKQSLLFISTNIGLIYTIFDTHLGSFINEPMIMNETLIEGSVVLSSSGSIYYASKQEHTIYELHITREFKLRYGKKIRTNAIKNPFGLITDQCNHLYIATRSMILVMFVQTNSTIRSVFSKASDLPITLERLNSSTYVYATIKKQPDKRLSFWMFNFLYFTEPDRPTFPTRYPAFNWDERLDFDDPGKGKTRLAKVWPISRLLSSTTTTTTMINLHTSSIIPFPASIKNMSKQSQTSTLLDKKQFLTRNRSTESNSYSKSTKTPSDSFIPTDNFKRKGNLTFNEETQFNPYFSKQSSKTYSHLNTTINPLHTNLPTDLQRKQNTSLIKDNQAHDYSSEKPSLDSKHFNHTKDTAETLFSDEDVQAYLQGRANLTEGQVKQIQAYLAKQSSTDYNILSRHLKGTKKSTGIISSDEKIVSPSTTKGNLLTNDDIHPQDDPGNLPPSHSKYINRTTTSPVQPLFSDDDLKSYLQGRTNLSASHEAQIRTYLSKQSSSDYNIFSKYSTSTKKVLFNDKFHSDNQITADRPSKDDDDQSHNYPGKLPSSNSTIYTQHSNLTTDTLRTLFSDDDLRSYLQGHKNLSDKQRTQIQAYLAEQSSSNYNIFSKYSTKPTLLSDEKIQSEFQRKGNVSMSEDNKSKEYLGKVTPSDSKYFNHTKDTGEILFTDEDVQSYLQGRTNLSPAKETQIRAYLAKQSSSDYNLFSKYLNSTINPWQSSKSISQKLVLFLTTRRSDLRRTSDSILHDIDNSAEQLSDVYSNSMYGDVLSEDTFNDYSKFSTSTSPLQLPTDPSIQSVNKPLTDRNNEDTQGILDSYDDELGRSSPFPSYLHSSSTPLDVTKSPNIDFSFDNKDKKIRIDDPINRRSTVFPSNQLTQEASDADLASSVLKDQSRVTQLNPTLDSEQQIAYDKNVKPTLRPSSVFNDDGSVYIDDDYPEETYQDGDNKVNSRLSPTKFPSRSRNDKKDNQYNESINNKQTSTLSTLITNKTVTLTEIPNDIGDEISHKYSSSTSVDGDIFSTRHPSLPFVMSNKTPKSSHHSRLSSPLHRSLAHSSTRSPKFDRFSSSKNFSEVITSSPEILADSLTTIVPSSSTTISSTITSLQSSHQFLPMQTTDASITSDTPKHRLVTTSSDVSTSRLAMHQSSFISTISSTLVPTTNDEQSLTTAFDQHTTKSPRTYIESSSLRYTESTEIFSSNYQSTLASTVPDDNLDSSSVAVTDKASTRSTIPTVDEGNPTSLDNRPLETTETLQLSSSVTNKDEKESFSTRSSFDIASTTFPHVYESKVSPTIGYSTSVVTHRSSRFRVPPRRRTSHESTTSTTTSTTTTRRYRTRTRKITHGQAQQSSPVSSSTTTITSLYQTISIYNNQSSISTQMSSLRSEWNPHQKEQTIEINPSLTKNDSNALVSNEMLNNIFNNISASTNKSIFFNLMNLPPSSWNLSLNTSESILLDIVLPTPLYPSTKGSTTNLTFTNIEANQFVTNIVGVPINLQFDRVETKQFSLKMNATDNTLKPNGTIPHSSDVIIGHVRSEQFELYLIKSDNMHVHVKQVDSATAELFLDSNFCTSESSLQINLNLSKNGTIRYGNRPPIQIGPVFTRVHMLKQSCDRDQPLTLFFDICQRENPCLNDGTCESLMPDYDDPSYSTQQTAHIGYKCNCPIHISGEHCQDLRYPFGYCFNGGSLFQIYDMNNKSIEKCICLKGFYGDHCEEDIDNCMGIDCSNHGICEDGIDTYKCSCFDGFYSLHCERTKVQQVLLKVATRSFGIVAILLIAGIAGLAVASDIHTYVTRKRQKNSLLNRIPRATSELFENSVLLLGFGDAPIEMNDLSIIGRKKKAIVLKQQQPTRATARNRRTTGYRQLSKRRTFRTFSKLSSRRYLISGSQTIL